MTTTINASTVSGLVNSADTSGILQLQTAGTTALTVDTSANVGIGTASPSARLHVVSTTLPQLRIEYNSSYYTTISNNGTFNVVDASTSNWYTFQRNGTAQMVIDNSGNVGIGTSSPAQKLHVYASSGDINTQVETAGAGQAGLNLYNSTRKYRLIADASANAFYIYDQTAGAERMRIDSSGNVGIGATSPRAKLEITDGTTNTAGETVYQAYVVGADRSGLTEGNITVQSNDAMAINKGGSIAFGGRAVSASASGANWSRIAGLKEDGTSSQYNGYLQFSTRSTASGMTEKMRIDSSGNLMIGDTSSTNKLYVNDQTNRGQTDSQFRVRGNGYSYYVWLDGTACYIGQESNSRELRVYSGGNSNVGTKLTAGSNAWATYSDERLKDIIEPIENAAQKVSTLRTVIGKYKTDEANKRRVFMIAQDVQAVLPEAVTEDAEGMLNMAYDHIVPLLSAAIKELKAINDTQAETINALTARIVALESK